MSKLKLRSVGELIGDVSVALASSNKRQGDAHLLSLDMLNASPKDLMLEVRGVNVGDIGEALLKYNLDKMTFDDLSGVIYGYSKAGQDDLEGRVKEVKTFGASNNTPNGTLKPVAFYSVSKYGVHHFTYNVVKKYFNEFKQDKRSGTRAMTYALMKKIVLGGEVKRLDNLSIALGL